MHLVTLNMFSDEVREAEEWLWDNYGPMTTENCDSEFCEKSFEHWYIKNDFDKKLWDILDQVDREKHNTVIRNYFTMVDQHPDKPPEHSHDGVWKLGDFNKTDYDYGSQEFFFDNEKDAIHFKLVWG